MTEFQCANCGRVEHISRMGEFPFRKKIGKLTIKDSFWLCKWCLTKAGKPYWVANDGYLELGVQISPSYKRKP
jgi:hypothetical protein